MSESLLGRRAADDGAPQGALGGGAQLPPGQQGAGAASLGAAAGCIATRAAAKHAHPTAGGSRADQPCLGLLSTRRCAMQM